MDKLNLTEKDLSSIGWDRWLRRNRWRLVGGCVGVFVVLLGFLVLANLEWMAILVRRCFLVVTVIWVALPCFWLLRKQSRVWKQYREDYADYIGK